MGKTWRSLHGPHQPSSGLILGIFLHEMRVQIKRLRWRVPQHQIRMQTALLVSHVAADRKSFSIDVSGPMDEQGAKHFLDAAAASPALRCLMWFMSAPDWPLASAAPAEQWLKTQHSWHRRQSKVLVRRVGDERR